MVIKAGNKTRVTKPDKNIILANNITPIDLANGRKQFVQSCSGCHKLFGQGGEVGPDLTGSGRSDLSYILENILDPNALVTREYQWVTLHMKDDRMLSGMIRNETDKTIRLKTVSDELIVSRKIIRRIVTATRSMMPEGLLATMKDEEVIALVRYLRTKEALK